jgi:cbb3-type cytochrome oxidase subunit 3
MQWSGWINFGITTALFIAFIVAIVYYYNPKMKTRVEGPKYRMLEDDDEATLRK